MGHVSGVVTFNAGESRSEINLTIVNDVVPEFREIFIVELTKPVGGASIGDRRTVDVIIEENDYPFGLFGYVHITSQAVIVNKKNCYAFYYGRAASADLEVQLVQLNHCDGVYSNY